MAENPRLVLNRLFIVLGALAILLIAAAFIAPAFIPWNSFRANLEAMASEAAGEPVAITGDIHFTLLPEPHLQFSGVTIGEGDTAARIAEVSARFPLLDFGRDRYTVTSLTLTRPVLDAAIDRDGRLRASLPLALATAAGGRVTVANATIDGGTLRIVDLRAGHRLAVEQVAAGLRIDASAGTVTLQGSGTVFGATYDLRLTAGAAKSGAAPLSFTLRPRDGSYALVAEGALDGAETFEGKVSYRREPPAPAADQSRDAGQGAFVIAGTVKANSSTVLLSDYTLQPDENRPATRLSGRAELTLGINPSFNAAVSGGVVAIPAPLDATRPGPAPYGFVELLSNLPIPALPPLPGTIAVGITQLDLGGTPLRNLQLEASSDGTAWQIGRFSALLPGNASLALSGRLTPGPSRGEFAGALRLTAPRLETVASLWRKPGSTGPLFGLAGAVSSEVIIVGDTLSLANAALDIGGDKIPFDIQLGLGSQHDLHLDARLGTLDAVQSARLFALLPDLRSDAGFPATFLSGAFDLAADELTLSGLVARDLHLAGNWEGGVLTLSSAEFADLGGVRLSATATVFGSLARPELSGNATLAITDPSAPAIGAIRSGLGLPPALAAQLPALLPAQLSVKLGAPSGKGGQTLVATGNLADTAIAASVELEQGLLRYGAGQMDVRMDLRSDDPALLSAQLGLGPVAMLAATGPMHVVGRATGHLGNRFETTFVAEAGDQSIGFAGDVLAPDLAGISGRGTVKLNLSDPAPLLSRFGIVGLNPPGFAATGSLAFEAGRSLELSDLSGTAGDRAFSANLALGTAGARPAISGEIHLVDGDLPSLYATIAGRAALLRSQDSPWPDGPVDLGDTARGTDGRVTVSIDRLALSTDSALSAVSFDLAWDETGTSLRRGTGILGEGNVNFDISLCCSGTAPDKSLSARVTASSVQMSALFPAIPDLGGTVTGSLRLDGAGDSLAAAASAVSGEGTFAITDLQLPRLDIAAVPQGIAALALADTSPEAFATAVDQALDGAPLAAPIVSGTLSIASGVVRSPNLAVSGSSAQLFGNLTARLADLSLGGSFSARPAALPAGFPLELPAVDFSLAPSGTLLAPVRTVDATALYNALLSKELERQVIEAEQRRAEEEARRQAEAAEAARLAEERERAEAARAAAEEKADADAAAKSGAEEPRADQPLDLGLPN